MYIIIHNAILLAISQNLMVTHYDSHLRLLNWPHHSATLMRGGEEKCMCIVGSQGAQGGGKWMHRHTYMYVHVPMYMYMVYTC